ncbi:CBK1 kinase activator protein MOB2 [Plectosphaerella cucumerina]|uniref:CBK1 kinase activator protein MOB2 n=1 Tax=Plectosphaerella cucumerina TaxID=40658 RepID=A0A8K0TQI9_9PEZI|nr:CBK1 kinase activator protein MOB2 [Plectosphaerella cucumerina]
MTALENDPAPLWLNPAYSRQIVKGNLMTLSAKPKTVEEGEWVAHHVVEHYRQLWNFVRVVHEKEENGDSICNPRSCPKMSAGSNHSYTWLNSRYQPVELPAAEYMTLMQRWISGKINDLRLFPTDPNTVSFASNPAITTTSSAQVLQQAAAAASASPADDPSGGPVEEDWIGRRSGFPKDFHDICRTIFVQMFRVYAHLYHNHFVEPFYHLNLEKQLNSCFSHFAMTAAELRLLKAEDFEPLQGLVDLWAAMGTFPTDSKVYQYANVTKGKQVLDTAGF